MIQISGEFRAGLCEQIRQPGRCSIVFYYRSGGAYFVPEFLVKSIEFRNIGDPLSRKLPTEECIIVLTDYDRLWDPSVSGNYCDNLEEGMVCLVRIGINAVGSNNVLWSEYVTYYMTDMPKWEKFLATFQFTREIGTLTSSFPGLYASSGQELNEVVFNALLGAYYDPREVNMIASQKLQDCPVNDHTDIKGRTVADVLLAVAFASGVSLRSSERGIELLNHFEVSETGTVKNPAIVRESDMLEMPKFSRIPLIKNVLATYFQDPSEIQDRMLLFETSSDYVPSEDHPLVINYNKSITGGSFQWYLTQNVRSIEYNAYRDHVAVTEIVRINASTPYLLKGSGIPATPQKNEKLSYGHINGTEIEEIENPLLNWTNCGGDPNVPFGRSVPEIRATYLVKTRDMYEFSYRGDPSIEHLDVITVEIPNLGFVPCIVIETVFKFENGFSGKLKVRPIKNPLEDQISHCAISDLAISDQAKTDAEY